MQHTEIGTFILKTSLYKKHLLSKLGPNILDILFYNDAMDCFCTQCNNMSIFLGENEDSYRAQIRSNLGLSIMVRPGAAPKEAVYNGTYLLDFYCTRNKTHKLNIILKIDDQKLFKIGQSPSALDLFQGDLTHYENVLGIYLKDLSSAVLLYSSNFGVAAFTHLRRIVENFFMAQAIKAWTETNLSEPIPNWSQLRFKDKMKLVHDYLPKSFTENPSLYTIVSTGIHSLSEEECLQYFSPLKDCIILSLDEMINDERKKILRDKVTKSLNEISSTVKKG